MWIWKEYHSSWWQFRNCRTRRNKKASCNKNKKQLRKLATKRNIAKKNWQKPHAMQNGKSTRVNLWMHVTIRFFLNNMVLIVCSVRIEYEADRAGPVTRAWADCGRPPRWSVCGRWAARTREGCRWRPSRESRPWYSSPSGCLTPPASARTVAQRIRNKYLYQINISFLFR